MARVWTLLCFFASAVTGFHTPGSFAPRLTRRISAASSEDDEDMADLRARRKEQDVSKTRMATTCSYLAREARGLGLSRCCTGC